jgi:hypothetical protein
LWRQIFGQNAGMDVGGIERSTFNNAKDFEKLLNGFMAAMNPGTQNPDSFKDVETGRTQVNLPQRPKYNSYAKAPTDSAEYMTAQMVEQGLTPSQIAAQMRTEFAASADGRPQDASGSILWEDNPADAKAETAFEAQVKAAQDQATALWDERTEYDSQVSTLNPQAQQALAEGRPWYEEVQTERSAAAKQYDDLGLPTPVDQWRDDDFSPGFEARKADNSQFEDLYRQVQAAQKDARSRFQDARRPTQGPSVGASSSQDSARLGREASDARALFAQAQQEYTTRDAVQRAQGHGANDIRAALARAGRTPFTEAMNARMGR